jgi:hypothetical protein
MLLDLLLELMLATFVQNGVLCLPPAAFESYVTSCSLTGRWVEVWTGDQWERQFRPHRYQKLTGCRKLVCERPAPPLGEGKP